MPLRQDSRGQTDAHCNDWWKNRVEPRFSGTLGSLGLYSGIAHELGVTLDLLADELREMLG
jgi:hypothetical protein